jgi:glycosyltransferase involved in cell wall biosynthesis
VRVTVAICTWNRSDLLQQTLDQMTCLHVPAGVDWELLVVDNNSTDGTQEVLRRFESRLPLRSVAERQAGASYARNRVLREAAGDYILWTDDDVLVQEDWLIEFDAAVRAHPTAAVIGGPIEPWFLTPPDPDLLMAFPSLRSGFCGVDYERASGPLPEDALVWGANMAFRRAAVEGVVFDTTLGPSPGLVMAGGEEGDYIRRVRERQGLVIWWDGLRVKHCVAPPRATLAYLKRYTVAKGRELVRLAPADDRSARFFGAPRWLWRQWGTNRIGYIAEACGLRLPMPEHTFHGSPVTQELSARARRLIYLRESFFLEGMIREYRDTHRTPSNRNTRTVEGNA